MKPGSSFLLAGLLLAACAKHPERLGEGEVLTSPVGRVWAQVCPGGNPEVVWLWLEEGGTFLAAWPDPDRWRREAGNAWTFDEARGRLQLTWADGYATAELRWTGSGRLLGTSTLRTCPSTVTLELSPVPPPR